jgi:hypothetical protein
MMDGKLKGFKKFSEKLRQQWEVPNVAREASGVLCRWTY